MLWSLQLALAFSVAPWTDAPVPPSPSPLPVARPSIVAPPPSPRPRATIAPEVQKKGRRSKRDPHPRLTQLKEREITIWKQILKKKTPADFYNLASVRLAIANEERRLKLITHVQYRQYLLKKAIPLLKLNIREWGRASRASDGVSYDVKSWSLVSKIMIAVKATVKTPPLAKGTKLFKGRATHYGGERLFDSSSYPEFHGSPTSVGDTFCMYGQTCAFMRAPLNTWVRVRNPRNSRFVDLRVSDTGAFEQFGVLIDLSRGAYNILGLRDRDRVLIRSIRASEVIPEPILCSGRGHAARSTKHLTEKHFFVPASWKKKNG